MSNRALVLCFCFVVNATPLRIIDGDTFTATVPVWLSITVTETVRVLGVNTPELKGATRPQAEAAREFTRQWLQGAGSHLSLRVCERDSFGRVLGRVTKLGPEGIQDLAADLIAAGHGVAR